MAKAKAEGAQQDELPTLEKTTVHLPWEAFRDLITLPRPEDLTPPPPAPVVVKRAAYAIEIAGRHANVVASFEVEVLAHEGWVSAPLLPTEGLVLASARLDKKDVVLAITDDHYALTLRGKGSYGVVLEYAVELSDPDAQSGLQLRTVQTPVAVVDLKIAKADLEVSVEPNFGLAVDAGKKQTRVVAAVGPVDSIAIDWRTRDEAPAVRLVPLVAAEISTSVAVGDHVLTLVSVVQLQIQKSPIDAVVVLLPAGVNFLAAEGDVVRDWEPEGSATDGRRARVRFHYDVEGGTSFVMRAELPFGDGETVDVPSLTLAWDRAWHVAAADASAAGKEPPARGKAAPEPVERQKGVLAISAEPRTEVKVGKTQNLVPIDVKELPATVPRSAHPAVFGMRWSRVPWSLALAVSVHEDLAVLVAAIDHAHVETLALEDGRVLTKAYLDVRNNSRQFLKVKLPPGAKLWSSFRAERPVKPAADAEGMIRIPLAKSGEGAPFTVELAWFYAGKAFGGGGSRDLVLPRFDLPVSYYSLQFYLPRRFRHYNFDGGLKRVEGLSRGFEFRGATEPEAGPSAMSQTRMQSNTGFAAAAGDGASASASSGQLPIRVPMLRRGLEARFERTLVVDEPVSITWECKRRKTDVV